MELKEIAVIHTDFPEKFGIPRQSGLVGGLQGTIVFSPEYRNADAIRGLNDFSHLWLVWGFSKAKKDHWFVFRKTGICHNGRKARSHYHSIRY